MKATAYPAYDITTPRNRIRAAVLDHFSALPQTPAHAAMVNEEIDELIQRASHSDGQYTEWNKSLGLHILIIPA